MEDKIEAFYATQFARLSIHRIAAQLKAKFYPDCNDRSESSFVSDVDALLRTEEGEEEAFQRLENIFNNEVMAFSRALSDLLYNNLTEERIPKLSKKRSSRRLLVSQSRDVMYGEIHGKVWRLMGLMRWWLNTQAITHSKTVIQAVKDNNKSPEVAAPQEEEEEQEEKNKQSVQTFVERLVYRVYRKAKVSDKYANHRAIIERLTEKVLAAVREQDFQITPKRFEILHKTIYKKLCKKCGSPELVLLSVSINEGDIEDFIVSTFTAKVMKAPKKGNNVSRLFSSVATVFTKRFSA